MELYITHIDTACILLEINGFRILTDPTLDEAGHWYHHGFGAVSKKTANPALSVAALGHIDLILLSHHQHGDNFDRAGKELAKTAPLILSTQAAAKAVPGVTGLRVWDTYVVENEKVPGLKITATPCQHRPWWLPEFFSGPVIGFVLEFPGQSNGVLYISGDTVYFKGIPEIAQRFPKIDIGIFHLGSAQFRYLSGLGRYTMDGKDLEKAVAVLKPNKVLPIHYRGWSHFKESEDLLRKQLKKKGLLEEKVQFLVSGERTRM